ncbi:HAD family phosphatase [Sinomicrobium kalidii]|uniref:HAD family hydrolase n=1 Tax=Sinomicrobium kalidii TaxID=2900738 RepID=UPI001E3BF3F7|nr:HAD family phosphatase [Sinomicrobium kalidii]UGU16416.1 HAD family phosphatase [Sinomicrobium kalidii]
MKNRIDTVIFDLGGVLIDWNPEYVFLDVFEGDREKMQWFFDNICTMNWNEEQDAGKSLADATEERVALFPQYEEWIRMYYGRWEEMLGGAIQGSVAILKSLIAQEKYKVVALTNWSAETFPIARERFDFLQWFEGIVVSGQENTRKPFREIYDITLDRFGIAAERSVFIDDNLRNVKAADTIGINGIRFTSPEQLSKSLGEFSIHV